jgi:ATP-dependent Zn protease
MAFRNLMDDGQLLEIAIHEAGHSVIARVFGLKAGRATLCDFDGGARAYFSDGEGVLSVMAILGGRAATQVILGCADDHGCSFDDAKAMRLLLADGLRSSWRARYMFKELLDDTRLLILGHRHRRAVEAVADALLAKETLSGAEIDQLMMDAEAWRRVTR